MKEERTYLAIDLKSFYASVECVERGLDPLNTNLLVADPTRTDKTICLAVSPSLKSYGIAGRARLYEAVERVAQVNALRRGTAPGGKLTGSSCLDSELKAHPDWEVSYIAAPPRMAYYIEYSTRIYQIYLKYVAPEDIHVYSIDEVFMDITDYLPANGLTPRQMAKQIMQDVLDSTGITATAGIGTNLYLCKIAMDIVAKHIPPDREGTRIAELNEESYRRQLWNHRPLTDFWRVGKGYAKKLEERGIHTMGDIARCSIGKETEFYNEELLYRLFGVAAELLIDHAWGWEPCTIADIKAYRPEHRSLCSGQVLQTPYTVEKARLVLHEMVDLLVLDLVERGLVTDQLVLMIGYDRENVKRGWSGSVETDAYGRTIPKAARGTISLPAHSSSGREIIGAVLAEYDRVADGELTVRRLNITANHLISEREAAQTEAEQLSLFGEDASRREALEREKKMQRAVIEIKKRFGKNAILKGMNLEDGATARERNRQIGGHKA